MKVLASGLTEVLNRIKRERERVLRTGYSTRAEGTGYGLSIVRNIADAHGWDVTITASDAGGARFEIRESGVR